MSHYFETPNGRAELHEIRATIWERDYVFTSANGVFSSTRLDLGTSVLFRLTDPPQDRPAHFLDLGCGFGPISVTLATECPQAHVDAIDVNERALELTEANAQRAGVNNRVHPSTPDQAKPKLYDEIWSNPPIRIGKQALHDLLDRWLARLTPIGSATLVVNKNLGADSLHAWLERQGWAVERLGSAKGFRVLRVTHQ